MTTGSDGTVRVWVTATGTNVATMRVDGSLSSVAIASPTVYAAGEHGLYAFSSEPPTVQRGDRRPRPG